MVVTSRPSQPATTLIISTSCLDYLNWLLGHTLIVEGVAILFASLGYRRSARGNNHGAPYEGLRTGESILSLIDRAKTWARSIKRDGVALWIAARDPRTPWYAKLLAAAVAAYALSPIDLIPDFIPVLGYIDDLIIVPVGILLVVKLVPPELMAEYRLKASDQTKPVSLFGLMVIAAMWLLCALILGWWALRALGLLK